MSVNGNHINIAFEGPDNSLLNYWQPIGATGWNLELVAGVGTTTSAPGAASNFVGNLVTAAGPFSSLWFYWQANGFPAWHAEQVAGLGAVA
jgi:hypothetical protein